MWLSTHGLALWARLKLARCVCLFRADNGALGGPTRVPAVRTQQSLAGSYALWRLAHWLAGGVAAWHAAGPKAGWVTALRFVDGRQYRWRVRELVHFFSILGEKIRVLWLTMVPSGCTAATLVQ